MIVPGAGRGKRRTGVERRGLRPTRPRPDATRGPDRPLVGPGAARRGLRGARLPHPEVAEHGPGDGEMAVERLAREDRVPTPEGVEDGVVEVRDPLAVHARDDERDVGPGERLQVAPDPVERGVRRDLDDASVERRVRRRLGVRVAGEGGPAHLRDVAAQLGEVRLGDPREGETRAELLELGAHGVRLAQLFRGRVADASATERVDLHDPDRLEAAQRLPDGRLADAVLLRHPGLHDAGAGRVPAGEDRLQEAILHLVGEDAARDLRAARHGLGPLFRDP